MFFSSSPVWQTSGLTLIRLTLGGFLIYHGWEIFNEVKINEYLAWDTFTQSNGKLLVYCFIAYYRNDVLYNLYAWQWYYLE